jgi:hypothetical protein
MHDSFFDYLTGTVNVSAIAPETWLGIEGLAPFYQNPNSSIWGKTLCRVLYHESLHFWQFLASGYVANLVNEEWVRILHYENNNEVLPRSEFINDYLRQKNNDPFSAYELVECWARYWDVHTRSPAVIIKEEGIVPDRDGSLEIDRGDIVPYYTSLAYDTVMAKGPDCERYARPYRWMLEKSDTRFAAFVFPILVHNAFGTREPVLTFCNAFERALQSSKLQDLIRQQPKDINYAWLNIWNEVIKEAILPSYTSGLDVIQRGRLREHPIFSEYITEIKSARGFLKILYFNQERLKEIVSETSKQQDRTLDNYDEQFLRDLVSVPFQDISLMWVPPVNSFYQLSVVFGLPGQPLYRFLLGQFLTPPRIKFENFTYNKPRSPLLRFSDNVRQQVPTYETYVDNMTARVKRFREVDT